MGLDWSEGAAEEFYKHESYGEGERGGIFKVERNGYAVGKKWSDWQVNIWLEYLRDGSRRVGWVGWLNFLKGLYRDKELPWWWLDKIFHKYLKEKAAFYEEEGIGDVWGMVEEMKEEEKKRGKHK